MRRGRSAQWWILDGLPTVHEPPCKRKTLGALPTEHSPMNNYTGIKILHCLRIGTASVVWRSPLSRPTQRFTLGRVLSKLDANIPAALQYVALSIRANYTALAYRCLRNTTAKLRKLAGLLWCKVSYSSWLLLSREIERESALGAEEIHLYHTLWKYFDRFNHFVQLLHLMVLSHSLARSTLEHCVPVHFNWCRSSHITWSKWMSRNYALTCSVYISLYTVYIPCQTEFYLGRAITWFRKPLCTMSCTPNATHTLRTSFCVECAKC